MKYIKTYEEQYDRRSNNEEFYHEGDYVQIKKLEVKNRDLVHQPFIAKIIAIDHVYSIVDAIFDDDLIIYSDRILRNATPEEIEQYEVEKKYDKYNL